MTKETPAAAITLASCLNLRRTIAFVLKTVDSLPTIPIMRLQQHGGAISSVGRASPLHGGGHQFESGIAHHFFYFAIFYNGSLAQSVEQLTFNQLVAGSNPARPTIVCSSSELRIDSCQHLIIFSFCPSYLLCVVQPPPSDMPITKA